MVTWRQIHCKSISTPNSHVFYVYCWIGAESFHGSRIFYIKIFCRWLKDVKWSDVSLKVVWGFSYYMNLLFLWTNCRIYVNQLNQRINHTNHNSAPLYPTCPPSVLRPCHLGQGTTKHIKQISPSKYLTMVTDVWLWPPILKNNLFHIGTIICKITVTCSDLFNFYMNFLINNQ